MGSVSATFEANASAAGTGATLTSGGARAAIGLRLARWHYFYALDRHLPPRGGLLEFGCGGPSSWVASRFQTVGLDLSWSSARNASAVFGAGVQADVSRLPFSSGHFDGVASSFVLEHLPRAIASPALTEIHRVLAPGGKLICLCDLDCDHPMLAGLRRFWPAGYREAYVDIPGHHGLVREHAWSDLLVEHGFKVVEWNLVSRFPLLDHCVVVHMDSTPHFPAPVRAVGRLGRRLTEVSSAVAPLWDASVVLCDTLARHALPKRWAYRLLFVAQK